MPDLVPVSPVRLAAQSGSACWSAASPLGLQVTVNNRGTGPAGAFSVDVNGARQRVAGLASGQSTTLWFQGYAQGAQRRRGRRPERGPEREQQGQQPAPGDRLDARASRPSAPRPRPTATPTPTLTPIGFRPRPRRYRLADRDAGPDAHARRRPASPPTPTSTPVGRDHALARPAGRADQAGRDVLVHVRGRLEPDQRGRRAQPRGRRRHLGQVVANAQWSPSPVDRRHRGDRPA